MASGIPSDPPPRARSGAVSMKPKSDPEKATEAANSAIKNAAMADQVVQQKLSEKDTDSNVPLEPESNEMLVQVQELQGRGRSASQDEIRKPVANAGRFLVAKTDLPKSKSSLPVHGNEAPRTLHATLQEMCLDREMVEKCQKALTTKPQDSPSSLGKVFTKKEFTRLGQPVEVVALKTDLEVLKTTSAKLNLVSELTIALQKAIPDQGMTASNYLPCFECAIAETSDKLFRQSTLQPGEGSFTDLSIVVRFGENIFAVSLGKSLVSLLDPKTGAVKPLVMPEKPKGGPSKFGEMRVGSSLGVYNDPKKGRQRPPITFSVSCHAAKDLQGSAFILLNQTDKGTAVAVAQLPEGGEASIWQVPNS